MTTTGKIDILVLEGDGIGPEIMAATLAVLRAADAKFGLGLTYEAAAVAPIGPLDAQRLLAAGDAGSRLAQLAVMLEERIGELRARLDLDVDE